MLALGVYGWKLARVKQGSHRRDLMEARYLMEGTADCRGPVAQRQDMLSQSDRT